MGAWISRAPFERLLNMKIEEARDGRSLLTMPFYQELAQGAGLMHGGALVSLADTAVVMAIKSIVGVGTYFATTSCSNEFLYPVKQGIVTAEARVARVDDRILEGEARLYNDERREVMRFEAVFKVGRDADISAVVYADR